MKLFRKFLALVLGIIFTAGAVVAAELARPIWLTDCSVNVKEAYDNNVFLSGVNAPPAYTVPAGSVAALAAPQGLVCFTTTAAGSSTNPASRVAPSRSSRLL